MGAVSLYAARSGPRREVSDLTLPTDHPCDHDQRGKEDDPDQCEG